MGCGRGCTIDRSSAHLLLLLDVASWHAGAAGWDQVTIVSFDRDSACHEAGGAVVPSFSTVSRIGRADSSGSSSRSGKTMLRGVFHRMRTDTTSREFFERKYERNADPWQFATSAYELHRYEAIISAIDHRRYHRAFEPGCAIGVLTERLAGICDEVDAIDISPTAVRLARQRCNLYPSVSIQCASLPDAIPEKEFDLLVFSEIGYYFPEPVLREHIRTMIARLAPEGVLVAAHWLGESPDHLLSGDQVHAVLEESKGLVLQRSKREAEFRLDQWMKVREVEG